MDNTVNQIPICRILPQERYRAGQGSNETHCTEHELPAGASPQIPIYLTDSSRNDTERVKALTKSRRTVHALS